MQKKILTFLIFTFFVLGFFLIFFGIKNFGKFIEESFVEINLNKNKFFPYETIQVEIRGVFSKPIFDDDVAIKRENLKMPVKFYVEKISNDYYIAYATLNLEKGKYDVEIKAYTERGVEIFKKSIEIEENDNRYFLNLFYAIKDKIDLLKNRELIYATQAIEGIDEEKYDYALNEILRKVNSFNDLEKAILLLSLKTNKEEFNVLKKKLINYFLTIQDNDLGIYFLNIKGNTNCTIKNTTYEILGEKNITIDVNDLISNNSINFSFSCENDSEAFLIKNYFENKKIYSFEKINNTYYLNKSLGSFDDSQITSIMLIVFYQNNISYYSLAYDWLKNNKRGIIENVALAYLNDRQALEELENYQNYDGSFNSDRDFSKAEITCFAYKVAPAKSLAEKWIRNNFDFMNIKEKSSCLVFALEKRNVIGFIPGVIKGYTGESFDVYLKNYGIKKVNVSLKNIILNLSYETEIERDKIKKLSINIPYISYEKNYLLDSIILEVDGTQNQIPILIFIKPTNITKPEINETTEENITINRTSESLNESSNFTIKFLSIVPEIINLSTTNQTSLKISIKNLYKETISVNVIKSASLEEIVRIEPLQLTLLPNQKQDINVYIDTKNAKMNSYEGIIEIEARFNEIKQYYEIPFNLEIVKTEKCEGKICKVNEICEGNYIYTQEGICCLGRCKPVKKENKTIGIVLVILGFIFLVAAVFFILKKPKKEKKIEEVIKKIKEKEMEKKI